MCKVSVDYVKALQSYSQNIDICQVILSLSVSVQFLGNLDVIFLKLNVIFIKSVRDFYPTTETPPNDLKLCTHLEHTIISCLVEVRKSTDSRLSIGTCFILCVGVFKQRKLVFR